MFENVDGRTDDGVTGILIAHLGAFGSGELIIKDQNLSISVTTALILHWLFQQINMVVKVQLFGHSFISPFKRFIRTNASDFDYNLNLDKLEVMIRFSGYPCASVKALIQRGLSDVYDFEPDLVILDIGTNDLSSSPPETVANAIVSLVYSLLCTT